MDQNQPQYNAAPTGQPPQQPVVTPPTVPLPQFSQPQGAFPGQPLPPQPSQKKSKKGLIIALIIAVIVLGLGIGAFFMLNKSSTSTNQAKSNGTKTSSGLGVDCNGQANPDIGKWQEYLVSKAGENECGYEVGTLLTTLTEPGGTNGFVIGVWPDNKLDSATPGYEVSIANIEFLVDNTAYKVSEHIFSNSDSSGSWSDYLNDAQTSFKDAQVMNSGVWKRAFGKELIFDEMFQAFSPTGNSFKIAPTFTDEGCPECKAPYDARREVRFGVNEQRKIQAIKFDLTVDGKTKTVAFSVNG